MILRKREKDHEEREFNPRENISPQAQSNYAQAATISHISVLCLQMNPLELEEILPPVKSEITSLERP